MFVLTINPRSPLQKASIKTIDALKYQNHKAMKISILTSQMYLGKSTNKGVVTYTLSANKFDGVHTEVDMHGNTINRAKIGCSVDIAKGGDRAKLKNYIKQCNWNCHELRSPLHHAPIENSPYVFPRLLHTCQI